MFHSIARKLPLALLMALMITAPVRAGGTTGGAGDASRGSTEYAAHGPSSWATYYRYYLENPEQKVSANKDFPKGMVNYGKNGETKENTEGPLIPGKKWPIITQPYVPQGPEKMMNWAKVMNEVTGYSQEPIGSANLSPAFAALSLGVAGQMLADELQSPQAAMPRAREEQNQQVQQSADNTAAMERQQAGCAIDFVASYLYNFTVDDGNRWNRVRNLLFLPMAILLLLPGAVLAQVKSIASQGMPVLGEMNPFEGIFRAVVAIFLIPGTYLVVNYGIDLANSITLTISDQYKKVFGTDMYKDAMCAHIRAFPFREPIENKNFVPNQEAKMTRLSPNDTPFARLESRMIDVKLMDPCAGLNIVPADRANEQVKYSVNAQRNAYNTANAALAMAWNILCAFQMAYLYYLWFVGPVVAALWVYPMKQLRDAFPSWCEGVITLCFWSLFWNTTVLLMACFRGVDETGTITMTALNFLATACVKFAFDFAGLVKDAGREAARMAERLAHGGGQAGAGGKNAAAAHTNGATGAGASGADGTAGRIGGAGDGGDDALLAEAPVGQDLLFEAGVTGRGAMPLAAMAHANGGDVVGAVPMRDIAPPPHTGHAAVVAGSLLGGLAAAGLLAEAGHALGALHGAPPVGSVINADPAGTVLDGAEPGMAAAAGTDSDGSQTGIATTGDALALTPADLNYDVTFEGDEYEHNWGDSAIASVLPAGMSLDSGLQMDLPPMSTTGPALSLTPGDLIDAFSGTAGMPPLAVADAAQVAPTTPLPNAEIPAHTGAVAFAGDPLHSHGPAGSVLGQPGADAQTGMNAGKAHDHGAVTAAQLHREAVLRDALATAMLHETSGLPPAAQQRREEAEQRRAAEVQANWEAAQAMQRDAAAANLANAQAMQRDAAANLANAQAMYRDATAAASLNAVPPSADSSSAGFVSAAFVPAGTANAPGYATTGGGSNFDMPIPDSGFRTTGSIDPSAASFAALAESVAASGTTAGLPLDECPDGADPGLSTIAAYSDYATTTLNAPSVALSDAQNLDIDQSYSSVSTSSLGDEITPLLPPAAACASNVDVTYTGDTTSQYSALSMQAPVIDNSTTAVAAPTYAPASADSGAGGCDAQAAALSAAGYPAPPPSAPSISSTSAAASVQQPASATADAVVALPPMPAGFAQSHQPAAVERLPDGSPPVGPSTNFFFNGSGVSYETQAAAGGASVSPEQNSNLAKAAAAGAEIAAVRLAQQNLRNQVASCPSVAQPVARSPIAKSPSVQARSLQAATGRPSRLSAALGRAGTRSPSQLGKPAAPPIQRNLPGSNQQHYARQSLQQAVEIASLRNRYRKSGQLTAEQIAKLEQSARQSGDWLPA